MYHRETELRSPRELLLEARPARFDVMGEGVSSLIIRPDILSCHEQLVAIELRPMAREPRSGVGRC